MSKLNIVQLESFYPHFLHETYSSFPGLQSLPFDSQTAFLLESGFSGGHNVVPYLDPTSWNTAYIVVNCPWSQTQWAKENQMGPVAIERDILVAQLEKIRPDVLYLSDIPGFDFSILSNLSKRPLVVGWHATALSAATPWHEFDLVLSGIEKIRQSALEYGAKAAAEFMPAAPPFRSNLSGTQRHGNLVFSGSFYGGIHDSRARQLMQVSRQIGSNSLSIYTPTRFEIQANDQIDFFPAVYGSRVIDLYSRYNIVLDSRGEFGLNDVLEPRETSNMRVFEATRAGALLLTERSPNLAKYFELGKEIETYSSFGELIDKIKYFSDPANHNERALIAKAGLRRVRKNHLIEHRAAWLEEILDTHFGMHLEQVHALPSKQVVRQAYSLSCSMDSVIFTLSSVVSLKESAPHAAIYLVCETPAVVEFMASLELDLVLIHQADLLSGGPFNTGPDLDGQRLLSSFRLVRHLLSQENNLQRVTHVGSDIEWSQPLVFPDSDASVYVGRFDLGAYGQIAQELVGLCTLGFVSVPRVAGSLQLIDKLIDAIAGNRAVGSAGLLLFKTVEGASPNNVDVQSLTVHTPWSLGTAKAGTPAPAGATIQHGSFLGPISFVQKGHWQFSAFDLAPGWSTWVSDVYVPYLQRVQSLFARFPALEGLQDQHSPSSTSAVCQFLARQEYLRRGGYRLLSLNEYRNFAVETSGWDTPSVAAIQHQAFQGLLANFRDGHQRADMQAISRIFQRFLKPHMRVLEEGCGSGYNSELIDTVAGNDWTYTGIDIAKAMVDLASTSYPRYQFKVMQSEQLDFADASFDIVLNGASLMHTIGYEQALKECRRVTSKYVVLHTVTIADMDENVHFEKNAYGSRVAEVCFSSRQLSQLLRKNNLLPVIMEDSIDYNLEAVVGVSTKSVSIGCYLLNDFSNLTQPEVSNHYCTYFDVNYLPRGVLMIRSLLKHDPKALVFVLCLDEITEQALVSLSPNIRIVPIRDLLSADPAFAQSRDNRSLIEWYFTATSCLVNYLLQQQPLIDRLIYLDADLYFYSTPEFLIDEAQGASVQIIEHRFSQDYANLIAFGRFNVAWISFTNTPEGRMVVDDYRASCLEWCYDRLEDDRFGDQKYLDKWPARYPNCCVSTLLGANVAWWNMARWTPKKFDTLAYVGTDLLIFYHFQEIKRSESGVYATKKDASEYGHYYDLFYAPYLAELTQVDGELRSFITNLSITDIRYKSW